MTTRRWFYLLLLGALALAGTTSIPVRAENGTIYVRHDAAGANDGSSWADAYTDLQDGLAVAQAGDEIWVARGVYYPAPDASDRSVTFALVDGVGLYGGFAGTETERDQRDWEANVTVLSGDLDRNDGTDEDGVVTDPENIVGDNAFHVVTGIDIGASAVLDGFVVTAGLADGSDGEIRGGGMYNADSSPTLVNVAFSGNQAGSGAGMYNLRSSPTLTDVTFTGNEATHTGGGMRNLNDSNPALTHVTFTGNQANSGGGMDNLRSSPALTDVTFTGNEATTDGGGMRNDNSSPTLTEVTFAGNRAHRGGGLTNLSDSSPTLTDVTFTGNQATTMGGGAGCSTRKAAPPSRTSRSPAMRALGAAG